MAEARASAILSDKRAAENAGEVLTVQLRVCTSCHSRNLHRLTGMQHANAVSALKWSYL